MEIRIHFPETDEEIQALRDKINEVHAHGVIKYISNLGYSESTKTVLYEHLRKKAVDLCKEKQLQES